MAQSLNQILTINDNAGLSNKPSMNNVIDSGKVDYIADTLVEKLGSPLSRPWYCKAAYALDGDTDTIFRLMTQALEKGRNPGALFNHLIQQEIQRRGANTLRRGLS